MGSLTPLVAAIFAVLLTAVGPRVVAAPTADFDLQRDFSTNANPNGVWSYGFKAEFAGPLTLLDTIGLGQTDDGVPLEYWSYGGGAPLFYHNGTTNTGYSGGAPPVPPGTLFAFPGTEAASQLAVARLTVPAAAGGLYRLESDVRLFYDPSIGVGTNSHTLLNDTLVFGAPVATPDNSGSTNLVFLGPQDTLDFVLGPGATDLGFTLSARLWFLSNVLPRPVITESPRDVTARVGSDVAFSASAEPVPVHYQWLHNAEVIPGETSRALELQGLQLGDGGTYAVVAANSAGSVTSAVATLTIDRKPRIVQTPLPLRSPPGWAGQFAVVVDGEGPFFYQWLQNGNPLTTANASVLGFPSLRATDVGIYAVIVSNTFGATTSAPVALIITSGVAFDLERDFSTLSNPNSAWNYGCSCDLAAPFPYFSAVTSHVNIPFDVGIEMEAWMYNETEPLALHNQNPFDVIYNSFTTLPPGAVAVFDGNRSSGIVRLKLPSGGPGAYLLRTRATYIASYLDNPIAPYADLQLTINSVPLAYLLIWQSGEAASTNVLSMNAGDVLDFVVGGEWAHSGLRLSATIDVLTNGLPLPAVTNEVRTVRVRQGQPVSFAAEVDGAPVLYYQWLHDGKLLAGQIQPTLSIPNVQPADTGLYSIVVSNNAGALTGAVAVLVLDESPLITASPQSLVSLVGSGAVFDVGVTGAAPLRYQWRFDGVDLTGETNRSLLIVHVAAGNAGDYSVVVTNDQGDATSAVAHLSVVSSADFDVQRDFSIASNPNGVWGYENGGDGMVLTALNGVPLEVWQRPVLPWLYPRFFHNATTMTAVQGAPSVYPPGAVVIFPGGLDNGVDNVARVRLTIPLGADGLYRVETAGVPHSDNVPFGDIYFGVGIRGAMVFWQSLPDQAGAGYTNRLVLSGGDLIDFMVVSFRSPSTHILPPGLQLYAVVNRLASTDPPAPVLQSSRDGSSLTLGFDATAGYLYRLLWSTNLAHWEPIATNGVARSGLLQFRVVPDGAGAAFYRLVTP